VEKAFSVLTRDNQGNRICGLRKAPLLRLKKFALQNTTIRLPAFPEQTTCQINRYGISAASNHPHRRRSRAYLRFSRPRRTAHSITDRLKRKTISPLAKAGAADFQSSLCNFYFVRKNLSVAMPYLGTASVSENSACLFLTLHGAYGVSKFATDILGDRANARALWASVSGRRRDDVLFGFNSAVVVLVDLDGERLVSGHGLAAVRRLLAHGFRLSNSPAEMSIWNISHSSRRRIDVILSVIWLIIGAWPFFFRP